MADRTPRSAAGKRPRTPRPEGSPQRSGQTRPAREGRAPAGRPSQRGQGARTGAQRPRPASQPAAARRPRTGAGGAGSYNAPSLWTKGPSGARPPQGPVAGALAALGRGLLALLSLIGRGLAFLAGALLALVRRSRVALAVLVAAAVLLVGGVADYGLNAGKAYPGVHVGQVDASGKDAEEIAALVEQAYGPRLAAGRAVVYASDEAAAAAQGAGPSAEDAALAEQRTADEAAAAATSWTADASSLAAVLPAADLAAQAVSVGRDEGGLLARLSALFGGWTVDARADYGADELEALAEGIDAAIGEARVDFGIAVDDGTASVTEGHDGNMVDRGTLARQLDAALLSSDGGEGSFVAHAQHAAVRIDREAAQAACDDVNAAIADGARLVHDGAAWDVGAAEVGAWVGTRVEERGGAFALVPYVDPAKAKPGVVKFAKEHADGGALRVSFDVSGDDVSVHADGADDIPLAADTVSALDAALFGDGGKAARVRSGDGVRGPVEVSLSMGPVPGTLSFDEALDLGIVEPIASYTTEFTTGAGTENRNHNIALVSQLLSNSVVQPGGRWSFNGTAGECNAERGFLGAGAIVDGEYDDAVGGGICQVATTVFNAVYDSGFPVVTRHNHSLYIASYPAGRDAAVSWPDLDLVWENDSESAVLVRVACADSSVTATLYGVSPGYRVGTQTGEWQEGEKHKSKTERDESLSPGTSYVKTRGTDGSTITVVRTVKDADGTLRHEDAFYSAYDPVTEVVVAGPEAESEDGSSDSAGSGDAAGAPAR